jgi:hypothetical protein
METVAAPELARLIRVIRVDEVQPEAASDAKPAVDRRENWGKTRFAQVAGTTKSSVPVQPAVNDALATTRTGDLPTATFAGDSVIDAGGLAARVSTGKGTKVAMQRHPANAAAAAVRPNTIAPPDISA